MKHPEFDMKTARWDAYHAFYNTFGIDRHWPQPFVLFDTGEVIVTQCSMKPDLRQRYNDLNVSLVSTHDNWCPKFKTKDGEAVKAAWLPSQYLLVDHDTGHVVSLEAGNFPDTVPTRFKNVAMAYFPGAGLPPAGRGTIKVNKPVPPTVEQRQQLEALRASCKAWAMMSEEAPKMQHRQPQLHHIRNPASTGWHDRYMPDPTYYAHASMPHDLALTLCFETMTNGQRMQIAECGFTCNYATTEHRRLLVA